jgi:hypothetical protein
MKVLFLLVLTIIVPLVAIASNGSGAGIVALDGWEHGVVICGEATIINEGHEADPEVAELLALADVMCPAIAAAHAQ